MPQPLSKFGPKSEIVLAQAVDDGKNLFPFFSPNPKFGFLAMEIVAAWSHVEMAEYKLFASLAGGSTSEVYEIYAGAQSASEKSRLFNLYAQKKLTTQYKDLLGAIRRASKTLQKDRDKIAHWTWGWIADRKDVVLCVDPRLFVLEVEGGGLENIFVYTEDELVSLARNCQSMSLLYSRFDLMIGLPDEAARAPLYDGLCSVPVIADRLSRPTSKTHPPEAPQSPG